MVIVVYRPKHRILNAKFGTFWLHTLMPGFFRKCTVALPSKAVSRMSRSADEGFALYEALYQKGINLVFLKEPHISTDTYRKALSAKVGLTGDKVDFILEGVNKYLMELAKEQIRLAFEQAQKEVDDLRQRTVEGMLTAKKNGKQIGQVKGAKLHIKKADKAKEIIMRCSKDFCGTSSDKEVMKIAGVSVMTYYKYKRELKMGEGCPLGYASPADI